MNAINRARQNAGLNLGHDDRQRFADVADLVVDRMHSVSLQGLTANSLIIVADLKSSQLIT